MTIIQHIKKKILPLLVMVWVFSITGCRHFEDCRTPYKSFVTIEFKPVNKNDKLSVIKITNPADDAVLGVLRENEPARINLSLNPNFYFVQWDIHDSSTAPPKRLTIHYQKEPVLISHRCGCAYKYMLNKVTSTFNVKNKMINKELSTFNDSEIDVQIYL